MMEKISISSGNTKMGKIQSVSLPPIVTCRKCCACAKKCYAAKICRLRENVRNAYERNLRILREDPESYWTQVRLAVATSRYFSFHVSGDIPDRDYLDEMFKVAGEFDTDILCFTKQYEIVNNYLDEGHIIPKNLHLTFSPWPGIPYENPYNLPEAHVMFKDGSTTADMEIAKPCGGNCMTCALAGEGCWVMQSGDQVYFDEH